MSTSLATFLAAVKAPETKAFAEMVRAVATRNNDAISEEYANAIESMVLEMYPAWKNEQDGELPPVVDVISAAHDLEEEYKNARDNRKRELLNRAFLGRFNPRLYKQGMSKILWDYVRQLEYPEAEYLRRLVATVQKNIKGHSLRARIQNDEGTSHLTTECMVSTMDADYLSATRLEAVGLVAHERASHYQVKVAPILGICVLLVEFIWADGRAEVPEAMEK